MVNIRICNDIPIKWRVTRLGNEISLSDFDLKLIMQGPLLTRIIDKYVVDGSVLKWVFHASEQSRPGCYTFSLMLSQAGKPVYCIDGDQVLNLVTDSALECNVHCVEMYSDLQIPSNGMSAYEIAVLNGFKGTEEEFAKLLVSGIMSDTIRRIVALTKSEYDNIAEKDPATMYVIVSKNETE